jgi:hypothetical protein
MGGWLCCERYACPYMAGMMPYIVTLTVITAVCFFIGTKKAV